MPAPATAFALPPLSQEQSLLLARLAESLDGSGLWWLSGYAAGLARAQPGSPVLAGTAHADARPDARVTVVYGSQTGNARRVAEALAARLRASGLPVRLVGADAYAARELRTSASSTWWSAPMATAIRRTMPAPWSTSSPAGARRRWHR